MRASYGRWIFVALGVIAMLAPSPAMGTGSETHWTIDEDSVTVAREKGTSYKLFQGGVEFFHTGSWIRAKVSGQVTKKHYSGIKITWRFQDGSTQVVGVNGTIVSDWTNSGSKNVVRVTISASGTYACTEPFCPEYTNKTVTVFAGDAPQSDGTCDKIDTDAVSLDSTEARAEGSIRWYCDPSTGRILARIEVALYRKSGATTSYAFVTGSITYKDGTRTTFISTTVTSSRQSISFTKVSDTAKQARRVDIEIDNKNGRLVGAHYNFGDAP